MHAERVSMCLHARVWAWTLLPCPHACAYTWARAQVNVHMERWLVGAQLTLNFYGDHLRVHPLRVSAYLPADTVRQVRVVVANTPCTHAPCLAMPMRLHTFGPRASLCTTPQLLLRWRRRRIQWCSSYATRQCTSSTCLRMALPRVLAGSPAAVPTCRHRHHRLPRRRPTHGRHQTSHGCRRRPWVSPSRSGGEAS